MAAIRKRGKRWFAEVRKKGYYKSKTFDTKVNALSWALEMEQSLSDESGIIRRKTVSDALDRYEADVSKEKR